MTETIETAAGDEHAALQRRLVELLEELRNYPSPISRWDAQIPALIAERSHIVARLREIAARPADPSAGTRAALEQRLSELIEEVRNYPTPIAGCDQHLPALLEERSRLVEQLRKLDDSPQACSPAAIWINDGGRHA